MDLEQVTCPINDGHRRGGRRIGDLNVVLPRGPVQDVVWTWYSECLVQDRVWELFNQAGFTGLHRKPVTARMNDLEFAELPTLWEIVVTGWGGLASPASGVKLLQLCPGCLHAKYSEIKEPQLLIDETRWDGSDFFMVWPMPNFIFITNRVAECVRDNHLTGVNLTRPRDYRHGRVPTGGFSPGRLSYCMPESRARLLGQQSGIAEG